MTRTEPVAEAFAPSVKTRQRGFREDLENLRTAGLVITRPKPTDASGYEVTFKPLSRRLVEIGRGQRCFVRLDDASISDPHGWIYGEPGNLRYRDASRRGTSVNGSRMVHQDEVAIKNGDALTIVGHTIEVVDPPAAASFDETEVQSDVAGEAAALVTKLGPTSLRTLHAAFVAHRKDPDLKVQRSDLAPTYEELFGEKLTPNMVKERTKLAYKKLGLGPSRFKLERAVKRYEALRSLAGRQIDFNLNARH